MQKKTQEGFGAEGRRICGGQAGRHGAVASVRPAVGRANNFNNAECRNAPNGSRTTQQLLRLLEPSVRPAKSHVCLIQQELLHSEAY